MTEEQKFEQTIINERLGRRIRGLREQVPMTQEELARNLNVTPQNVGQIERGERARNVDELGEIARALGVTTADLMIDGLGYPGEPTRITGAGKAGAEGSGKRS